MDNDDDATISAYSVLFRSHLSTFSAHLAGTSSSSSSPSSSRSPSPTQEAQHTWSRIEQDAFYHALRTHSRLRPDLIAASVRTKNVLEVCAHLATLDAASRALPASESVRDLTPAAVEVSQAWIEWEERAAERLTICMHTADTCAEQPEGNPDAERHAALHSLTATHLTVLDRILSASESSLPPDTSGTPDPDPDPVPDPNLSPRSRRRIQKRLYMRRRRAVDRGESPPPFVHANTKLVPGRKKKPRRAPTGRPKKYKKRGVGTNELVESDLESDSGSGKEEEGEGEGEGEEESGVKDGDKGKGREAHLDAADIGTDTEYAHTHQGGITAPYRLHTRLSALGIDAAWLARADMDMFHLARLGTLQRMSNPLSSSKSEACINTAISPDTIRLLTQLLRAFTHAAIAHAIALQEHESRMKGGMRVWHTPTSGEGEVGPGIVRRAVHGMGAGARWGKEDGASAWGGASEEGEEGQEGDKDQGMKQDGEEEDIEMQDDEYDDDDLASLDYTPPRFRPEHDLHAPLVVLPLIYRTLMGEGGHNSNEVKHEGGDEGGEEEDEGEGGNESDDATLDAEDARRARAYERALWAAVARGGA